MQTFRPLPVSPDDHDDDPMRCGNPDCGWSGTRKETTHGEVRSYRPLALREGHEYCCPRCGWLISASYTRIS